MKVKDRSDEPWEQTSIKIVQGKLQELYKNNIRLFSSCNMSREAFDNVFCIIFGVKK